ncbi:hypothetical protein [Aureibacter tunicatorum]|uniref:HEPN domain-containing protein n=1 Tax=Aureibacter tunicatorum TaxID=866807 RepID=A0AAE3XLI5_9BACT|nr:hypothetical protein [Aureibacter tunicatorum]MDR6238657.1 hypothetical protein [Aureibacter tunicatorum]BDD05412.1 hypothetical protein AUTU_28950 [Aureibacter tunicatorum]
MNQEFNTLRESIQEINNALATINKQELKNIETCIFLENEITLLKSSIIFRKIIAFISQQPNLQYQGLINKKRNFQNIKGHSQFHELKELNICLRNYNGIVHEELEASYPRWGKKGSEISINLIVESLNEIVLGAINFIEGVQKIMNAKEDSN